MAEKKHLTCPKCGNKNISISEKMVSSRYFQIEDNLLFGINDSIPIPNGEVWVHCCTCELEVEWKATDEEKKIIDKMLNKAYQSVDVSEFMEKTN